jgi:uncharacterized delta-60 repeat protein
MRIRTSLPLALSVVLLTAAPGWALDPTFAGDGRQTTNFTAGFDAGHDLAIQADGRIVVVGEASGSGGRFAMARYDTDGSLDTTFGGGDGKVITNLTPNDDAARAVAIQPDGKIVVVGMAGRRIAPSGFIVSRFAVARYATDGTLDDTFGGDGKVFTDFSAGEDVAEAVAIRGGTILAVGSSNFGCSCARFAFARYGDDGSLDATFSGDGTRTVAFPPFGGNARAAVVRGNGKIVAAGFNSDLSSFVVARLLEDGSLDTAFSDDGRVVTRFGRGEAGAEGVAVQSDGRIVVAGFTDLPHEFGDRFGPGKFALIRYLADGRLDPSFGGDGTVKVRFGRRHSAAEDVAIEGDGDLVAVGGVSGRGGRFALVRLTPDGSRDASLSGDGRVTVNFSPALDEARGVGIEADGDLVLAGQAGGLGGRFGVCRLLGT